VVSALGRATLGLGYRIFLTDVMIAPVFLMRYGARWRALPNRCSSAR
jgi:hypothetical protein